MPSSFKLAATLNNPAYANLTNITVSAVVLAVILIVAKYAKGFFCNIAVLCGIIAGGLLAASLGMMHFDHVADAQWFHIITPFYFACRFSTP